GEVEVHGEEVKEGQEDEVDIVFEMDGDGEVCYKVVKNGSSRLWEGCGEDKDFVEIWVGKGEVGFEINVKAAGADGYDKER
ncbi:hypothetical protein, partial [Paenibacillus sp. Y412MC10]|uniref:hypothetical protein n=1 Tax=Geobacillus sp. (strain Y412MC10) TaxID=481743 RepID=UPI0016430E60